MEEEKETQKSQNMGQGAVGISMLGQRQVTYRRANNPVWLNNRTRQESGLGRVQAPPPEGFRRRAEKGGAGVRRM